MPDSRTADPTVIAEFLRLLHREGDCFEVRAPKSSERAGRSYLATWAGYYNDIDIAAAQIAELDDERAAPAIYVTLNPVNPALLARHNNHMQFNARDLTKAGDVVGRRTLLLDFDPARPSAISSTYDEWMAALELAATVRDALSDVGWPDPVFGSSGNGAHLLYRVDLDPGSDLIGRLLAELSTRYSTETVTVDSGVHDANRITKVLGTMSRKGDELLDVAPAEQRPHRRAEIVDAPDHLAPVAPELLEAAATAAAASARAVSTATSGRNVEASELEQWREVLSSHGVEVKSIKRGDGATLLLLDRCVVNPTIESTNESDIAIIVGDDGNCGYKNFHERGAHYTIADVRSKLESSGIVASGFVDGELDEDASQADKMVAIGRKADLFHSTAGADPEAFAATQIAGHRETWPVRSRHFRLWLLRRFWETYRKAPNKEAVNSALNTLEAMALFKGDARVTALRVHECAGSIVIDLCDKNWQAIRITAAGWEPVRQEELDFHFVRRRGMEPLPIPQAGGSIDELREFLNLPDDATWMLTVAFIVMAFSGQGPYPVLAITGEQGSAKSTLARIVRATIDPNESELRSPPREERDLVIAARNSRVLAFDNLSGLKPELADAICRMSTGAGFGTRELYTDDEEVLFSVQRPVMINGIDDLATRSDLADRSLFLHLARIESDARVTERSLWQAFRATRPSILGAIFDAVSCALRNRSRVELETLPRMADFATFIVAACSALGWDPAHFLTAYEENRQESFRNAIESTAIGPAVLKFIADRGSWAGTAQDLLKAISMPSYVLMRPHGERGWPMAPRGMGGALRRIAPALRSLGYTVRFTRKGSGASTRRLIELACPPDANADETIETVETVGRGGGEGCSHGR